MSMSSGIRIEEVVKQKIFTPQKIGDAAKRIMSAITNNGLESIVIFIIVISSIKELLGRPFSVAWMMLLLIFISVYLVDIYIPHKKE